MTCDVHDRGLLANGCTLAEPIIIVGKVTTLCVLLQSSEFVLPLTPSACKINFSSERFLNAPVPNSNP